ncbi:DNA-3-methyladenine glycosylase I [Armatimonas rosea]|uniref:DNA-3-methyladenine glycosylase I n=1 Tax=Armatimonas rosea TaxID=685828 RepID=A0A7W9SP15_ARMRO|nr:DNA-3-methyladenine glycosylase I [Armatimonas rosea]MBB6049870.1 DNA-3-methyladenine glycosylase I [Armatimonas rosea]
MSYCEFVRSGKAHPVHVHYHDQVYGFPVESDDALFERLVLEINQAGLSWETILKKQEGFRAAYDSFEIARVAAYGDDDIARLLADPGIIRNRLKVRAAVTNARKILELQASYGSFKSWLDSHHPQEKPAWVALFKKTFAFTGGEIVGEFLMSCGYLPGAHDPDCPVQPPRPLSA